MATEYWAAYAKPEIAKHGIEDGDLISVFPTSMGAPSQFRESGKFRWKRVGQDVLDLLAAPRAAEALEKQYLAHGAKPSKKDADTFAKYRKAMDAIRLGRNPIKIAPALASSIDTKPNSVDDSLGTLADVAVYKPGLEPQAVQI